MRTQKVWKDHDYCARSKFVLFNYGTYMIDVDEKLIVSYLANDLTELFLDTEIKAKSIGPSVMKNNERVFPLIDENYVIDER